MPDVVDYKKARDAVMSDLTKRYGQGAVMLLGSKPQTMHPTIPTGIYKLDNYVLAGGLPQGRIVEIYGPESSGKTTLTLQSIAQAQKLGMNAAFIDVEHALDPIYAAKLGVDVDNLLVSQPDSGEQALEITESLVRSGAFGVVVVDSVAALTPQAELNGEMGDAVMGAQARLMSQACRKLTAVVSKSNTCLIFINQIRSKIGVMFGNPETTTGGRALPFYASLRLDVRKVTAMKDGEEVTGAKSKIKCVKNKFGPPFRVAEVDIVFGAGFDGVGSLLDVAVDSGVVDKAGAWYSYKGERIGQGREAAVHTLRTNEGFYNPIYKETLAKDTLNAA